MSMLYKTSVNKILRKCCRGKVLSQLGLAGLLLLLSGCIVGPNYRHPLVAIPAKFKEAPPGWKVAHPQDEDDRGAWWEIFHDPELNKLESQVNISNLNIEAVAAQFQQAIALVDEARASYYPTVTGEASYTRQKFPVSNVTSGSISTGSVTSGGFTGTTTLNTYLLEGLASWEPDIWGLVHRTVEASKAGAQASAALLAATRLSTQSTLAQDYFALRTMDSDEKLLNETVISYRNTLRLTKSSYYQGVSAIADIAAAETQLKAAEALAIDVGVARSETEHAIAVLIGKTPSTFSIPKMPLTASPPPIPITLPSSLLERRPDVAQLERQVAQANAQIGVAIAAFFPALPLTATAGYESNILSRLFTEPSLFWSLGAALTDTIFEGGLRHATVRAAWANYNSTVALYRQGVLTAIQNVEDNLSSLRILDHEFQVQNQAAVAAKLSLKFELADYKHGTASYFNVITAQTAYYTQQKAAIDIQGRQMTAAVGLVVALGGGWDVDSITHAVPPMRH